MKCFDRLVTHLDMTWKVSTENCCVTFTWTCIDMAEKLRQNIARFQRTLSTTQWCKPHSMSVSLFSFYAIETDYSSSASLSLRLHLYLLAWWWRWICTLLFQYNQTDSTWWPKWDVSATSICCCCYCYCYRYCHCYIPRERILYRVMVIRMKQDHWTKVPLFLGPISGQV